MPTVRASLEAESWEDDRWRNGNEKERERKRVGKRKGEKGWKSRHTEPPVAPVALLETASANTSRTLRRPRRRLRSFVPRRTPFVIFKAEPSRASFLLEKMTRHAQRAMRRFGHFIFRQLIHLCGCLFPALLLLHAFIFSSTFICSPTFSMFSRLLFQMRFVRQQINFFWTVEGWISKHFFTKYSRYAITDIIIISYSKIIFVRHIAKDYS